MSELTLADAVIADLLQLTTKLNEDLAAARAIGDGKASSIKMSNGSVIEIGDADRRRSELQFTLRALRGFLESLGVNGDLLRSLGWVMLAVTHAERGATDPLFKPTTGRPGAKANLKEEFELSDAAAAVTILVDHKCCALDKASEWVSGELRRRGIEIAAKTIDRHRRRFDATLREAAKRPAKHKPTIVLAKRHYDESLKFAQRRFSDGLEADLSETDAAWIAAERILDRIAAPLEGKLSVRALNILRQEEQRSGE